MITYDGDEAAAHFSQHEICQRTIAAPEQDSSHHHGLRHNPATTVADNTGTYKRANATIISKLRLHHQQNPRIPWPKLLQKALEEYRSIPHSITKMPPVYLLFGITPSYINKLTRAYPPIEEARKIANEITEKLHLKLVKRYNESHKTPNLKIGDKVLYKIPYQSGQGKLMPAFYPEPYTIISIPSPPTIEIDKPCQPENKHATIVNISKVKLWDPVTEDNTEPPFPFQEEEDLEGCLGIEPNKQASTDSPQVLFSSIKEKKSRSPHRAPGETTAGFGKITKKLPWNGILHGECLHRHHNDGRNCVGRHRGEDTLPACIRYRYSGPLPGVMKYIPKTHSTKSLRRIASTPSRLKFLPNICHEEASIIFTGHGHILADVALVHPDTDPTWPHFSKEPQTVDNFLFSYLEFLIHRIQTAILLGLTHLISTSKARLNLSCNFLVS
ncbi:hypothetical protein LAZ67_7001917 [Cordylochernes scorpioides]|uniref:Uncharacterized protein n=1 Tax=Cordylochernes scorpioides TaxID=51811 RepID=A0ABY6KR95_9ARAC|nr:hypothetical protein LAZ67_7001917 [Cordylochernes scorpioides]